MDTELLRSFLAVTNYGSYTRAAEALHLSQPAVYQHVRKLEDIFHTKLVEQSGKRVIATEHGRLVREYAQMVDNIINELKSIIADDEMLGRGHLLLAAGTTVGEFVLPHLCVAFQAIYPGIHIRLLVINDHHEIDKSVRDHKIDLGFHSNPVPFDGVVKDAFTEDELVLIAPPGHRLAERPLIYQDDLQGEDLVLFGNANAVIYRLTQEWLGEISTRVRSRLEMTSLSSIKAAVRDGAGVALVSRHIVRGEDHSLVVRPLFGRPTRQSYVIYRENGWKSHAQRAFLQFALEQRRRIL